MSHTPTTNTTPKEEIKRKNNIKIQYLKHPIFTNTKYMCHLCIQRLSFFLKRLFNQCFFKVPGDSALVGDGSFTPSSASNNVSGVGGKFNCRAIICSMPPIISLENADLSVYLFNAFGLDIAMVVSNSPR
mmetsp:Transcript_25479/g.37674  ORF Transcript_25479/g.37674 Transcript_25479/m.37674 type:complete len:130 (-) Transcript_25479:324-713(-)